MTAEQTLKQNLMPIIDIARLAPSVHNAQPWKIKNQGAALEIEIDRSHRLVYSDPTGRETIISLGIFCEALLIGAAVYGLGLRAVELIKGGAKLEFKKSDAVNDKRKDEDIASLKSRHTDRSIYGPVEITASDIAKIENSSSFTGVTIKVSTDRALINKVAALTAKGIGLALSSPDFRKELSGFLALPFGGKNRGISVLSLDLPLPLALAEPKFIRWGVGLKAEVKTEHKRWLSASAVIFITTTGDVAADWFRTGRAYLRASLAAESLGLAQATSAATVEASTFHEDVEGLLNTKQRLQSVTRLGKTGSKKVYSPRVSAEELLST